MDLNSKEPAVTDWPVQSKPPIPAKKKMTVSAASNGPYASMDHMDDTQNLEVSVVESIKLNESDLKELEDEFTFDEGSDDEEAAEIDKPNDATRESIGKLKRRSNKFVTESFKDKMNESSSGVMLTAIAGYPTSSRNGDCSTITKRFENIGASNLSTDLVSFVR